MSTATYYAAWWDKILLMFNTGFVGNSSAADESYYNHRCFAVQKTDIFYLPKALKIKVLGTSSQKYQDMLLLLAIY